MAPTHPSPPHPHPLTSGDGKCVVCDSYVRPCTLVRICDECNYGSYQGRCVICGGPGVSGAYYCKECTIEEKDVRCPGGGGGGWTRRGKVARCFASCAPGRRQRSRVHYERRRVGRKREEEKGQTEETRVFASTTA